MIRRILALAALIAVLQAARPVGVARAAMNAYSAQPAGSGSPGH